MLYMRGLRAASVVVSGAAVSSESGPRPCRMRFETTRRAFSLGGHGAARERGGGRGARGGDLRREEGREVHCIAGASVLEMDVRGALSRTESDLHEEGDVDVRA